MEMSDLLRLALEKHHLEITDEIKKLISKASKDKYLGDKVYECDNNRIQLLYYKEDIAGICWPRRDSDGRYRTGPIYVLPEYRGKGVASSFVIEYFKDREGRAYIEPSNLSSINTFKKAGFKKVEKSSRNKNVDFDLYQKDV